MAEEKLSLNTILYGLIVPVIIGLVIILFATEIRVWLLNYFGMESSVPYILTFGFAWMIMFGLPLLMGLIWNKWAGGAAGFLMGSIYYLAMAGYSSFTYLSYGQTWNFYADASLLTYIVVGILIGYIAGALNNNSYSFKRMLIAGMTAAITTGLLQFLVNYQWALEPNRNMTLADPAYAFFLVMLPAIILGVLVPIVAKVITWYGLSPKHM